MNRLTMALAHAVVVTAFCAVPSSAGDDEALKKDLTAVIALHGLPCGQVVDVKVQARERLLRLLSGREQISRLPEYGGPGRRGEAGAG